MTKITKKIVVGVLMGGPSSEHDVSLATGRNVMENLDRNKYEPIGIKMTKDKEWFVRGRKTTETKALAGCDVIFNALHYLWFQNDYFRFPFLRQRTHLHHQFFLRFNRSFTIRF